MAKPPSNQGSIVERSADGKILKGTPNPGGLTSEARVARDILQNALRTPTLFHEWLVAYRKEINAGNSIILKDYADRVGGKVRELAAVDGDTNNPLAALVNASVEQLLAIVGQREE